MVVIFFILFFGKFFLWKGWGMVMVLFGFVVVYGMVFVVEIFCSGVIDEYVVNVGDIGFFVIEWGWVVDGFFILMYFFVGVVGFFVFVYVNGYMKGDFCYIWFFVFFMLFVGGMFVLVLVLNFI